MSKSYFSLNSQIENKGRKKKWEMGNQEFGSLIWKGIELGPEKWEMGTKSEFSSLKVRPQFLKSLYFIFSVVTTVSLLYDLGYLFDD